MSRGAIGRVKQFEDRLGGIKHQLGAYRIGECIVRTLCVDDSLRCVQSGATLCLLFFLAHRTHLRGDAAKDRLLVGIVFGRIA